MPYFCYSNSKTCRSPNFTKKTPENPQKIPESSGRMVLRILGPYNRYIYHHKLCFEGRKISISRDFQCLTKQVSELVMVDTYCVSWKNTQKKIWPLTFPKPTVMAPGRKDMNFLITLIGVVYVSSCYKFCIIVCNLCNYAKLWLDMLTVPCSNLCQVTFPSPILLVAMLPARRHEEVPRSHCYGDTIGPRCRWPNVGIVESNAYEPGYVHPQRIPVLDREVLRKIQQNLVIFLELNRTTEKRSKRWVVLRSSQRTPKRWK